jgi:cobalt-zinc-cadmium efflux system outer membrane protein
MTGKTIRCVLWIALNFFLLTAVLFGSQDSERQVQSEFSVKNPQLQVYTNEALERNPKIRQSFALYQAALQRLPQAGSLPDPMLNVTQYIRSPETRVGPQTTMLSISQNLPWFGKLSDKEKVAAKEAEEKRFLYEAQRAETVKQVKLLYYSLGFIDRMTEITQEDISILERYETMARARYRQGVGLQQSVVKLQAEITKDQNKLEELRNQRVDMEAVLNEIRDVSSVSPVPKVIFGESPEVKIEIGSLFEFGKENRPEIQAALLQIEKNEKRVQLAHRNYWPDFTVGAGFTNVMDRSDPAGVLMPPDQNGKNIYSVTVGVNIPLRRKKYDAALEEATQDKVASGEAYRAAVNALESSVRVIGFRIETLQSQIRLFNNTLLPQAEQALSSTEAAYSTGTLGILDLLDSERVLVEVKFGLARLNSDYMKSLAEMERAIGTAYQEKQR